MARNIKVDCGTGIARRVNGEYRIGIYASEVGFLIFMVGADYG